MPRPKITLEDLANKIDGVESGLTKKIDGVEKSLSKKIEDEIGGLAVMTKRGFDKVDERFNGVDSRLKNLEQGQEDIKLRQDNTAHRFELNALGERVTKLEKAHQPH